MLQIMPALPRGEGMPLITYHLSSGSENTDWLLTIA